VDVIAQTTAAASSSSSRQAVAVHADRRARARADRRRTHGLVACGSAEFDHDSDPKDALLIHHHQMEMVMLCSAVL
jgi:hypothetical protein